jgi:hypothetical protein
MIVRGFRGIDLAASLARSLGGVASRQVIRIAWIGVVSGWRACVRIHAPRWNLGFDDDGFSGFGVDDGGAFAFAFAVDGGRRRRVIGCPRRWAHSRIQGAVSRGAGRVRGGV